MSIRRIEDPPRRLSPGEKPKVFVFQLVARYCCPFTGFVGRKDTEKRSSTLFATHEGAERRKEKFAALIRERLRVATDYEIDVFIQEYEVIED